MSRDDNWILPCISVDKHTTTEHNEYKRHVCPLRPRTCTLAPTGEGQDDPNVSLAAHGKDT